MKSLTSQNSLAFIHMMYLKSLLAKPFAALISRQIQKSAQNALADQSRIFQQQIEAGAKTKFGEDHLLKEVKTHEEYCQAVKLRDYEQLKSYIQLIKDGRHNVLWKGLPIYFAKTSGTTSGVKYIPITKDSIGNHINTARNALLCYMSESGNNQFVEGNMIFLTGTPELERVGNIPTGRLSGIVNHHVPGYLRKNQLPSYETNCIADWETKLNAIVNETVDKNMTLISGIPPWMQMYFDRLHEKSGKPVGELFPGFSVLVHGGVNFEPYRKKLFESIGREVDTIETFPASEGFMAFQDTMREEGLLLNTNSGIFFEFIPAGEIFNENPTRLKLEEVKTGVNYAIILTSNAGLWSYNIGDTVRFVSTAPYRIVVSGRIKHFISAFGEHVIGEEVEYAILDAAKEYNASVVEFTVAPNIAQDEGQSYHEWFVEFGRLPEDMPGFSKAVDDRLRKRNVYYDDLIRGNILLPLKIRTVQTNGFIQYMKSVGKLGGQNKVPRLSNDRKVAEGLELFAS